MTVELLLVRLTQMTVILIASITLVDALRQRDRVRLDIFLMFGSLGLIVCIQLYSAILGPSALLGKVSSILLMSQPYLLLRLVQHLRRVPRWMEGFASAGMVASWALVLAFPASLPLPITLLLVAYFAYVESYSAVALIRGALASRGVSHTRLLLAASGSLLIAAVILTSGLITLFPAAQEVLQPISGFLGLLAMVSFYLGFGTPAFLRRALQLRELHRFLQDSSGQPSGESQSGALARLCTAAERTVGGHGAQVFLWDEGAGGLKFHACRFPPPAPETPGIDPQTLTSFYERLQAAALPDLRHDPAAGEDRTILVSPIANRERAWGLLVVYLDYAPLFAADDLDLLSLFGEQTAILLGYGSLLTEQGALIDQLRRYNQRLESLAELDRAILAARNPERIATAALSRLRQVTGCHRTALVLFDINAGQGTYLAVDAEPGLGPAAGETMPIEAFPSIDQVTGKDAYFRYIEDISSLQYRPPIMEMIHTNGIRSIILAPLIVERELIGELTISSREVRAFQPDDLQTAHEVANQLAITIQQARLRESLQGYADELEARVAERTVQLEAAVENLQREISARKRASTALRSAQERLRFLLSATPAVIYSTNPNAFFATTFISENITHQLGYTVDEFFDTPDIWRQNIHPEDAPLALRSIERVLEHGQGAVEYRFRRKDGEYRWMRDEFRLVRDLDNRPLEIVGFWIDITERKRAEEAIRQLNRDLQQRAVELRSANKELEAFTYSVSHDLRAPLRAIDGFSRILMTRFADGLPPEAARYLQLVRENTQQMGELIDDLLSFSRLNRQSLNKTMFEPSGLVHLVLRDLLKSRDEQQVEVKIGDLPFCEADPNLLKQVFTNLLSNALKFTSRRERAVIEIGCRVQDGEQVYFVKDNGVGFDMKYADKLFEVFQRLHRAEDYEGTGVGLAIVQRIIKRHGGRVWAESELDVGATFYFTLPAVEPAHPQPAELQGSPG